jgi:hypothetical protein
MQRAQFGFLGSLLIIARLSLLVDASELNDADFTKNVSLALKISDDFKTATHSSPLPDIAEAEQCYQSWARYASKPTPSVWQRCNPPKTLSPSDYVPYSGTSILMTIQSFGPNSTYKACDGITRLRFSSGAVLTTSISLISVTRHGYVLGSWTEQCTASMTNTPTRPLCDVPGSLCEKLWSSYIARVGAGIL